MNQAQSQQDGNKKESSCCCFKRVKEQGFVKAIIFILLGLTIAIPYFRHLISHNINIILGIFFIGYGVSTLISKVSKK
jgi:hypothetical protein